MKHLLLIASFLILTSFTFQNTLCGDLLNQYAEKPSQVKFIECVEGEGQIIVEARYEVSGEDSKEVEIFLKRKYGMGKMKFACCGWESTNGKNGYVDVEQLKKINPSYVLEISMFGNAEMTDENGEDYIEQDRTKVQFTVLAKVIEI